VNANNRLVCAALLLYCAGALISLSLRLEHIQWDFAVYYRAPQAYARGLDPYRMIVPCAVDGSAAPRGFKFYYPPLMLALFAPFSLLGYPAAARLFFSINCAALAALVVVWRNKFLGGRAGALFYLLCAASFGSPLYLALRAGNVVLMEQCLLWMGFHFFLDRRSAAFCLCVLAAAVFKVTPLFFLSLLLFVEDNRRWRCLAGSVGALCAGAAVVGILAPGLWVRFLHNSTRILYKAQPSTYAMLRELLPPACVWPAYATLAAAVLACTAIAAARLGAGGRGRMIYLACAAYAVVLPHFEDYSYMLLIPPAYALLRDAGPARRWLPACLFLAASSAGGSIPLAAPGMGFVMRYVPLILVYCIWVVFAWGAIREGVAVTSPDGPPAPGG
jgi:hypothetical protein